MKTKYWVAKYIDDVFRDEPVNIGIFVEIGGKYYNKFAGETSDGGIDGRKVKYLYPDVYRQWVNYWRRQIDGGNFEEIVNPNDVNYKVVAGGEISDIEGDDPIDVLNYLYSMLISEGGFKEAIGIEDEVAANFLEDVTTEFSQKNLFAAGEDTGVWHPIIRDHTLTVKSKVKAFSYKPRFFQENGKAYPIDVADFTTSKKRLTMDHAGYLAHVFGQLCESAPEKYNPIALIKVTDEDKENQDVRAGLTILGNLNQITKVNWLIDDERNAFLEEREQIAKSDQEIK